MFLQFSFSNMIIGFIFLTVLILVVLSALVFLVLFFISSIISNTHGAPYVPIKRRLAKRLLAWGSVLADDILYDLGCGDARVLISAVKDFGVKKAIGYEVAPWPYLEARFACWFSGTNSRTKIIRRNFFEADLRGASFVYAYLFPKLVDKLASKMAGELQAGTKILCPSFPINLARHPEFKLLKSEKFARITAYLYQKI